jgi:hypothetical protein
MPIQTTEYAVTLTLVTEMLGTAPSDPEIYASHIVVKKNKTLMKAAVAKDDKPEIAKLRQEDLDLQVEELSTLPKDDRGLTVFRIDKDGCLFLPDYMAKGFLKEAGEACTGTWGLRGKLDRWLFITPRQILILRDGQPIKKADSNFQRPLRAQTMMGPRTTLTNSEQIDPGCTLSFTVTVLENGTKDGALGKGKTGITSELLQDWFSYGAYSGLGQFRSGSYGRFTAVVTEI